MSSFRNSSKSIHSFMLIVYFLSGSYLAISFVCTLTNKHSITIAENQAMFRMDVLAWVCAAAICSLISTLAGYFNCSRPLMFAHIVCISLSVSFQIICLKIITDYSIFTHIQLISEESFKDAVVLYREENEEFSTRLHTPRKMKATYLLDTLQEKWGCCGYKDIKVWKESCPTKSEPPKAECYLPASCFSNNDHIYLKPCKDILNPIRKSWSTAWSKLTLYITLSIQISGLFLSSFVMSNIGYPGFEAEPLPSELSLRSSSTCE